MARRTRIQPLSDARWLEDVSTVVDNAWARISTHGPVIDDEGKRLAIPAPNAIEWVVGDDWCNSPSTYEYWGQYQIIRDFFELRCPLCNKAGDATVWGKSRTELEGEALLVWDADVGEDVCPKCATTRSEFTEDGFFNGYNTLHGCIGQRAGKSVMAGLIGSYMEHRIITLGLTTPGGFGRYLGLEIKDPFEMTFLASTDTQSQDTVWAKYAAIRAESPWFQRYVPWCKKQEEIQVVPEGMKKWFYKESDKRIVNFHPNVRLICNSLNSNAPGLRGRTRPAAFADEISHMEQTDSKKSATEIYRALERSLRTVRSRVKLFGGLPWLGTMASVTSPVSRGDKGMELLRDASKVKTMFARHLPTWEFNPFEPRENLQDEYDKDPIGAERDYGANPPGAEHPLIHDDKRWRKLAVDESLKPCAEFTIHEFTGRTGQQYIAAKVKNCMFVRDRIPRYVVWDAGQNFDAFAGACAHAEWVPDENEPDKQRLVTVFDWVLRILPRQGTEVFFDSVVDIMRALKDNMSIVRCEFDRWQSIQLIQQIREAGIYSERKSTTDADYLQFRIDSFNGRVRALPPLAGEFDPKYESYLWTREPPELSAQACAIYEILGAQQDPDTNRIIFPEKGQRRGYSSNDVAQVLVHAHVLTQRQQYTEKHDDRSRTAARMRAETTGTGYESRGFVVRTPASFNRGGGGRRGW